MFGRNSSSRLPSIDTTEPSELLSSALEKYAKTAERNRKYADAKLSTKPSPIKPGDQVLIKTQKINKLSPLYKPEKLTVTARKGSWVVCTDNKGKEIARNISFLKLMNIPPDITEETAHENPLISEDESNHSSQETEQESDLEDYTIDFSLNQPPSPTVIKKSPAEAQPNITPPSGTSPRTPQGTKHHVKVASEKKAKSRRRPIIDYREARPYNRKSRVATPESAPAERQDP